MGAIIAIHLPLLWWILYLMM